MKTRQTLKNIMGIMSNLEPIPYNPPYVLDGDAYPITQTWTDIIKQSQMQLKRNLATLQAQLCQIP